MHEGRVYYLGQIGSIVRVPHGSVDLLGAVSMVGIAELNPPLPPTNITSQGSRWIEFQLLGQLDGTGRFQRGVSTYPALDDPVHFATQETVRAVYPPAGSGWIRIGVMSTSANEPIAIDLARLVLRHSLVVGATGSGKSSTVASIIQSTLKSGYGRANIVVIDPHGEYAKAMESWAAVRSVTGGESMLSIPYWALPFTDFARVFATGSETAAARMRLQDLIVAERRAFASKAKWLDVPAEDISADTPIPYDLRRVWYDLDFESHATYPHQNGQGSPMVANAGDAQTLTPATFQPYALGSAAPFRGPQYGACTALADRISFRLKDPRFSFLRVEWPDPTSSRDPLASCVQDWLGGDKGVSVLDFSGVASEATDVAVGVVLSLLFEVAVSSPPNSGIGRARPLLIVLEEAHRYLGSKPAASGVLAADAANRVAREGRKYGVGLMAVTQRPTELSDVILSQVGTHIALRLTNSSDQSAVKTSLPDAVANMAEALPSLRNGEALVAGEAIPLPTRVLIDRPSPAPRADDPSLESWKGHAEPNDVAEALQAWRHRSRAG